MLQSTKLAFSQPSGRCASNVSSVTTAAVSTVLQSPAPTCARLLSIEVAKHALEDERDTAIVHEDTDCVKCCNGSGSSIAVASAYAQPPEEVLRVMRAPPFAGPHVSPCGDRLLSVTWQIHPTLEQVARPDVALAGIRLELANRHRRNTPRGNGIRTLATSYVLIDIVNKVNTKVLLPEDSHVLAPQWSADGKYFAFQRVATDGIELWVGDGHTGSIRKVPNVRINPMLYHELQWTPDQKTLLAKLVPADMTRPAAPAAPSAPIIQQSMGNEGPHGTTEAMDVLKDHHDEDLFTYYATLQLALIDVETFLVESIGVQGCYYEVSPSPNGKHILVSTIVKPYSYAATYQRCPQEVKIWSLAKHCKVQTKAVAHIPLADNIAHWNGTPAPHDFHWRATHPEMLLWVDPLDGGVWSVEVPHRARIIALKAPFTDPWEVCRLTDRFWDLVF